MMNEIYSYNTCNSDICEYTLTELHDLLSYKCNDIISEFPKIQIRGEIIECKLYKNNSGIAFKILKDNKTLNCKVWARVINPLLIKENENTNSILVGYIRHDDFMSKHDFYLEITDIVKENNESKIKKLKEQCEIKGYFDNKKSINWCNTTKIGIISKKDTQGYNDFMKQFLIPLHTTLLEIALEGDTTEKGVIESIRKLEVQVDIILIIRGGGSTIDISNSFDTIEIFDAIKKSQIPVITAIGHEADRDDKLLITRISDLDFSTPSTAALEINKIFLEPQIEKLNNIIEEIQDKFNDNIEKEEKKEYTVLQSLLGQFVKDKFGGPIVNIEGDEQFIIIQKGDEFYKNVIHFHEKMDFTQKEILYKNNLDEAIQNEDLISIQENFTCLNDKKHILTEKIIETMDNIKNIEKLISKFEDVKPKKIKTLYCKKFNSTKDTKNEKLIQLYSIHLWYANLLQDLNMENKEEFNDVFKYLQMNASIS
jgi:exodeoxyribonuclease VII large subunit